ncbi:TetR/AcrR family transcriptional regulator [Microbacterium sp. B2969]|uniref:TetR/AcrR family transcriptional regulator n=1 Tax=Microbacterium alkaliflavum TaxID=3248839 RepID=A0ABW7QET6_9MICO
MDERSTMGVSVRAANTQGRILVAARTEFAASGLGGGRVDRIAALAEVNKERIYAYFGDKQRLFTATVASAILEVAQAVSQDAADVAAFAQGVFDFIGSHPETLRLLAWARLESDPWDEATQQLQDLPQPEAMIARWQEAGAISAGWDARDLYLIIWGMCEMWHSPPFRAEGNDAAAVNAHRRALVGSAISTLAENDPSRPN